MIRVARRKLDEFGRVVMPVDLTEEFEFGKEDKLNLQVVEDAVFLRKMSEYQDGYNDIQLDELGRIRIPKELLDEMGCERNCVIGIYVVDKFTIGFKLEKQ